MRLWLLAVGIRARVDPVDYSILVPAMVARYHRRISVGYESYQCTYAIIEAFKVFSILSHWHCIDALPTCRWFYAEILSCARIVGSRAYREQWQSHDVVENRIRTRNKLNWYFYWKKTTFLFLMSRSDLSNREHAASHFHAIHLSAHHRDFLHILASRL